MWWFDIRIHCEMITIIKLFKLCVTLHSFLFFVVWTLKIHSLRKLQIYNTVVFAIVSTMHIRPPELIHFITESMYPFTSQFSYPLSLWQPPFYSLLLWVQLCYVPHISEIIQYFSLSDLSPSIVTSRSIYTVKKAGFSYFYGWIIFHFTFMSHFLYPSIHL